MKKLTLGLTIVGLLASSLVAKSAETLIEENKCMDCHNIMGMKYAPPFSAIAKMNSGWFGNSKNSIKNSIKLGSQGKYPMFSNTKMPAFSKLNDEEIEILADWVIAQGSKDMRHGMRHRMMNHM